MEFEEFVAARGQALLRYAYLLTGDRHSAQDLVQEALVKALRHWSRVAAADQPEAYVKRILTNEHVDSRRRRWHLVRLLPAPEDGPTAGRLDDPADRVAVHDELRTALLELTPAQRTVLVLRHYEGYTDSAIAAVLGCGEVAVRSHASRGLARLRAELAEPVTSREDER